MIETAEAVHTGLFEISSPREQRVSGYGRLEEVGHQGGGLSGIGCIRLPKPSAHPLFLHAQLDVRFASFVGSSAQVLPVFFVSAMEADSHSNDDCTDHRSDYPRPGNFRLD
jgi:hypothetical protein